ncbi:MULTISPECIES: DNA polymerase III subunit gamma/tau [Clostridium]|uniref:DNA polymerase III subunit gamma/tau n=1 Tax=Clostridium TaxID=1485 RepID=UPI00069E7951|nr:DNA polymerase III subunit gamma/tau [Clostridium sp. DMHC 10]KOF55617.1 DNA polymerase III subunit gamma/tau [Clostridium sp. DMHC 10]MCD2346784.1 DNA polymerase III subunit gamma/tau [Clostridium guangxiense]
MAYTALYREWRPKNFSEVVGQEHVTVTLRNQVKNNRIAHAYLLCGTRGTGKTTTAKILSKAVNCLNPKDGEPCNECEMCKKINEGMAIDVTELDAASNNSVDDIRNIIDDVQYPPHEAKYKVYIIDEVHMLSQGAVNAFLKTLEEPPQNVVFILATTDPHKLPITILSRCQRFDFKRIKKDAMVNRLREIVTAQGVFADDKSLNLIARMSDGAARDAVSILDQAISVGNGKIEYEKVLDMLGLVTNEYIFKLMDCIIDKNVEACIRTIDEIVFSGKEIGIFIKDLIEHVRNLMMIKVSKNPEEVLDMSSENLSIVKEQSKKVRIEETMRYIGILQEADEQARKSSNSRIYLELAIIKMCKVEYDTSNEIILSRLNKLERLIKSGNIVVNNNSGNEKTPAPKVQNKVNNEMQVPIQASDDADEDTAIKTDVTLDDVKKIWKDAIEMFRANRNMVMGVHLSNGNPVACNNGVIQIGFDKQYNFSKQHLEKVQNNKKVEEVFSNMLHGRVKVVYSSQGNDDIKNASPENAEDIIKKTFGEDNVDIIDE